MMQKAVRIENFIWNEIMLDIRRQIHYYLLVRVAP